MQQLLQEKPPDMPQGDIDFMLRDKTPAHCRDALVNLNEQITKENALLEEGEGDPSDLARYQFFAKVCELRGSQRESVVVD